MVRQSSFLLFLQTERSGCISLSGNEIHREAIGYDNKLTAALYKALQASGTKVVNYGTVFVTLADPDKEEALPLIRRFYQLGFNIEATQGTANFLREHGIRTRVKAKLSEGSNEIVDLLRGGFVTYVINTRDVNSTEQETMVISSAALLWKTTSPCLLLWIPLRYCWMFWKKSPSVYPPSTRKGVSL